MLIKILTALLLVATMNIAAAKEVTCPAFQSLSQVTYDNAQPQTQGNLTVRFADGTSRQTIDAYRNALVCRGAKIDAPDYNKLTLEGSTTAKFAKELSKSPDVTSLQYQSNTTDGESMSPLFTMSPMFPGMSPFDSNG
ncbi:hypothetical protein J3B02_005526, partial [Coemansia erecta]